MDAQLILSEKEAQVLINMIDLAVKSKGIEIAESALYLVNKIELSFKNKQNTKCVDVKENVDVMSQE